jgi:protocatechuate 3,4-dioxygenase beta subunit
MGYTLGDGLTIGASGVGLQLYKVVGSTKTTMAGVGVNPATAITGVGTATFTNVPVANTYEVRGRALTANYKVLNDTATALVLDGSDQSYTVPTLGKTSFMVKTTNNELRGRVQSRYGASNVAGLVVTIAPTAMNIQGSPAKSDTTAAGGWYSIDGLREGPYTVTVSAGDSAYSFLRTLKKTASPAASAINSDGLAATDNNDSPTQGTRDLQGVADSKVVNFEGYRNDTKFAGAVVNDRDTDLTTIDPGEALAGAKINLYRDDDGSATANTSDTLVATATTDANGAYSFTGLLEGRYTAVWVANTPSTDVQVVRSISSANVPSTKVTATPLMSANVVASGNLPAWNYANLASMTNIAPANFTFVYANTVVQGKVLKQAAGNAPVAGMTVQMQKCFTVTFAGTTLTTVSGPRPDVANNKCTAYLPGVSTTVTDAAGAFQFTGLREGVYRVIPLGGTVVPAYANYVGVATGFAASPGANDNEAGLFLTSGSGDIESLIFHVY